MNKFILLIILIILNCKSVRVKPIQIPSTDLTENYSYQLDILCYKYVNNESFDYSLGDCEESLGAARQGLNSTGHYFISETKNSRLNILIQLIERENNYKVLHYLNKLSLGLIPDISSIEFEMKISVKDYLGNKIYEGSAKEKLEVTWHLIYLFHSPFVNPDVKSREIIHDLAKFLSIKIK